MPKILVIGNGFDLANDLPTKYSDFLLFCKIVMEIKKTSTANFEEIKSKFKKYSIKEEIWNFFERYCNNKISKKDECKKKYIELEKNICDNTWYEFFIEKFDNNRMKGINWIDFESEITDTIKELEEYLDKDKNMQYVFSDIEENKENYLKRFTKKAQLNAEKNVKTINTKIHNIDGRVTESIIRMLQENSAIDSLMIKDNLIKNNEITLKDKKSPNSTNMYTEYLNNAIKNVNITSEVNSETENTSKSNSKFDSESNFKLDSAFNNEFGNILKNPFINTMIKIIVNEKNGIEIDLKRLKSKALKDLNDDLNKLTRALEIYFTVFAVMVEHKEVKQFDGKTFDYILSFNYTNTIERYYDRYINDFKNICYIHGKADKNHDIDSCGLVLGIEEYLTEEKDKDTKLDFIGFKKYYQRILKETNNDYSNWIEEISLNKSVQFELHIFGHSLDITDKDILEQLILNDNVVTYIYYHRKYPSDKSNYGEKIQNLVKVIGQEQLIKRTCGKYKTIHFIAQPVTNVKGKIENIHWTNQDLAFADFRGTTFRHANLGGVDFTNADLRGVDWNSTVNGRNANFSNADMREVKITSDLRGAKYNTNTKFSDNFNPSERHMILDND